MSLTPLPDFEIIDICLTILGQISKQTSAYISS